MTVVLDSCVDGTAALLADRPGLILVAVDHGMVGAARAAGIAHATSADPVPDRVWLANTDADTLVPPTWLVAQLDLADLGHEVVLGTVEPFPADLSPELLEAWHARHDLREGHDHVHGANLGLTLAAYDRVGGFGWVRVHEDVAARRAAPCRRRAVVQHQQHPGDDLGAPVGPDPGAGSRATSGSWRRARERRLRAR